MRTDPGQLYLPYHEMQALFCTTHLMAKLRLSHWFLEWDGDARREHGKKISFGVQKSLVSW